MELATRLAARQGRDALAPLTRTMLIAIDVACRKQHPLKRSRLTYLLSGDSQLFLSLFHLIKRKGNACRHFCCMPIHLCDGLRLTLGKLDQPGTVLATFKFNLLPQILHLFCGILILQSESMLLLWKDLPAIYRQSPFSMCDLRMLHQVIVLAYKEFIHTEGCLCKRPHTNTYLLLYGQGISAHL